MIDPSLVPPGIRLLSVRLLSALALPVAAGLARHCFLLGKMDARQTSPIPEVRA